jgi:hypothetical protein
VTIAVILAQAVPTRYCRNGKRQAHHIHGAPVQGEPACQPSNRLVSMRTVPIQRSGLFAHNGCSTPGWRLTGVKTPIAAPVFTVKLANVVAQ